VRVDANAVPGPATLRIELISSTGKQARPTELPIVLRK
jgi:hypothetical protein